MDYFDRFHIRYDGLYQDDLFLNEETTTVFPCVKINDEDNAFDTLKTMVILGYFTILVDAILYKSNQLLNFGFTIQNQTELLTGVYLVQLLHILSGKQIQCVEKFNNQTYIDRILRPAFEKSTFVWRNLQNSSPSLAASKKYCREYFG